MVDEKKIRDISELRHENLIYYRICEVLYVEMKLTKYNTFTNMCSNIKDLIVTTKTPLRGELRRLLNKTIQQVGTVYGFSRQETIEYIIKFFADNKWEVYQDLVKVFYTKTKTSFQ